MAGMQGKESNIEGFAVKKDLPTEPITNSKDSTEIPYAFSLNNLVLIVIDALRTDFVTNNKSETNFPYLNKMLDEKKAISFNAKAHHPTVTLPRIKAITSGGIPGFMDVVFNFHSSEFEEDNIVTQSVLNGKNVLFYGDGTWLRLFPHHFKRSEGTTSFFVSDYTEVDNNVTTNLNNELKRLDWDFLILHYLGLDHIGHKEGPFSALVPPKLREMDEVIERLHRELEHRDGSSMIVICGDHGMSDNGNHGGASKEETSIPLIFIHNHKRFVNRSVVNVNQISITPTLSVLLNLPLPKNNLGVILSDVLIDLKPREKLYAMFANFYQMSKLKGDIEEFTQHGAVKMHQKWLETFNSNQSYDDISKQIEMYQRAINEFSEESSQNLIDQDLRLVLLGVFVVWMVAREQLLFINYTVERHRVDIFNAVPTLKV
uniref:Uncharacterized protein n=1 Tax=Strigamia maritima TaxID=126957 RepID=T1JP07_STRMM